MKERRAKLNHKSRKVIMTVTNVTISAFHDEMDDRSSTRPGVALVPRLIAMQGTKKTNCFSAVKPFEVEVKTNILLEKQTKLSLET